MNGINFSTGINTFLAQSVLMMCDRNVLIKSNGGQTSAEWASIMKQHTLTKIVSLALSARKAS